jgi:hypothetical protein
VFDLTQLSADTRAQVQTLSQHGGENPGPRPQGNYR